MPVVEDFFFSDGFAGGLMGAALIIAASYFVDVRLALKELPWHLKLLFVLAGGLTGAIFDHHFDLQLLFGVAIGSGWTYVIKALREAARDYASGKKLSKLSGGSPEKILDELSAQLPTQIGDDSKNEPNS